MYTANNTRPFTGTGTVKGAYTNTDTSTDAGHQAAQPGITVDMASLMRFEHRQHKRIARPNKLSKHARRGDFRSLFKGKGMAFSEVRHYQPGDDVRTIDWRVTARRGGQPHTKIFEEERERPVYIVVDQRSHMFFGTQRCFKSVLACEIGALLAWQALAVGDRISHLVLEDTHLNQHRPQAGKRGVLGCLQALVHANQKLWHNRQNPGANQRQTTSTTASTTTSTTTTGTAVPATAPDITQLLESVSRLAKPGSYVVLISDFLGLNEDATQYALRKLAEHTQTYGIFLYDLLEAHLPVADRLDFTNGTQAFTLDARSKNTRTQYQTQFLQHLKSTQGLFQNVGIPLLLRGTHQETDPSLLWALHDPKWRQADVQESEQRLTQSNPILRNASTSTRTPWRA